MANKRINELLADNPGFIPTSDDGLVVYDTATNITKAATLDNLIPAGINGVLFRILSSNGTGTNVNTAQPWFPTNGSVTIEANKTYVFRGFLRLSRAAGTTSHTTSLLFGGTGTVSAINWQAIVNTGDTVATGTANVVSSEVATATVVKAASTSATEQTSVFVVGTVRFTAVGTFIPQFIYSAAPGGAPSVLTGSYFEMFPIGSNLVTSKGTWS